MRAHRFIPALFLKSLTVGTQSLLPLYFSNQYLQLLCQARCAVLKTLFYKALRLPWRGRHYPSAGIAIGSVKIFDLVPNLWWVRRIYCQ